MFRFRFFLFDVPCTERSRTERSWGMHLAPKGPGALVRFSDPGSCSGPGLSTRPVPFRRYITVPFVLPCWSCSLPWSCLVSSGCAVRQVSSVCRIFFGPGTGPGSSPGWSSLSVPFRSVRFCCCAAYPSVLALVPCPGCSGSLVVVRFAGFVWEFCFSCFLLR